MHAKIISLSIYFFYVVGSLKWGKKSLEWNNNNISSVFWIHLLTWEIKKWFIRNLWCTVSRHDFNYFQKACTLHLKNKLNFTTKKKSLKFFKKKLIIVWHPRCDPKKKYCNTNKTSIDSFKTGFLDSRLYSLFLLSWKKFFNSAHI